MGSDVMGEGETGCQMNNSDVRCEQRPRHEPRQP